MFFCTPSHTHERMLPPVRRIAERSWRRWRAPRDGAVFHGDRHHRHLVLLLDDVVCGAVHQVGQLDVRTPRQTAEGSPPTPRARRRRARRSAMPVPTQDCHRSGHQSFRGTGRLRARQVGDRAAGNSFRKHRGAAEGLQGRQQRTCRPRGRCFNERRRGRAIKRWWLADETRDDERVDHDSNRYAVGGRPGTKLLLKLKLWVIARR